MNKQLSERADLEYLKGEAQALLASLNAGDPDALQRVGTPRKSYQLADAEHILAREYGFASWTKLKEHLETSDNRRTAFFSGVRTGDRQTVRRLLETDWSLVHIRDPEYFDAPAINLAAERNDQRMMELLLEFGADIDARSTWWAGGFGALDLANEETSAFLLERGAKLTAHAAARLGLVSELNAILHTNPGAVSERGGDGQYPLHFAKTPEIVDILVDAGAELDARDIDHEGTAAQFLIMNTPVLLRLLERGATPDVYMAVMLQDLSLLERMVVTDPDALGRTPRMPGNPMIPQAPGMHVYTYNIGLGRPFQIATRHGKEVAYKWFSDHSSPRFLFLAACWDANVGEARRLLASTPDLLESLDENDRKLLPEAAWERKVEAVRLMLDLGFDPNTVGGHHSAAVDRAAFHGFDDVIEAILPYNPDLTIRNEFGGTPLGACIYGSVHSWRKDGDFPRSVELLIAAGSPLPDRATGSPEVIEVLAKHGVPIVEV